MNAALTQLGFATHPVDSYRYFVGDGTEYDVRRALPKEHVDDETVRKCVAIATEQYSKRWSNKTKPYEGVAELLDGLDKRDIPKAILSNKDDEFAQVTVKKLLADWSFDIVHGISSSIPKKPDPAGALKIIDELNVTPQQIIYLGDTNTDMQTANKAGMYAVGALWGFRTAEELHANGAKILVQTPQDVLKLLE